MSFETSNSFTTGSIGGVPSSLRRRDLVFTADGAGDAGSITIDNYFGRLVGVGLTETGHLQIVDSEGIDLLNGYNEVFTGRLTFSTPNPVVGGITITLDSLPANSTGKVVIYAYDE